VGGGNGWRWEGRSRGFAVGGARAAAVDRRYLGGDALCIAVDGRIGRLVPWGAGGRVWSGSLE